MKDYYKILGVDVTSTIEEIKKSFRQKALRIHPDKSGRDTKDEFIELFEAYSILVDKKARGRYDLIYDWINTDQPKQQDQPKQRDQPKQQDNPLTNEIIAIQTQAVAYAKDFKTFDKEVLTKILLDLLLVLDELVFVSVIAVLIGLATIIKGFGNLDFEYSFVGLILTCIGLFFGKLKIDNIREFEERYRPRQ